VVPKFRVGSGKEAPFSAREGEGAKFWWMSVARVGTGWGRAGDASAGQVLAKWRPHPRPKWFGK
jgi:hypothetical protein